MFGIAGSHRSGKSTLAKALADARGFDYLETKVSDVFKDLGLDPKTDLPFAQRLDVQDKILRSLEIQYGLRAGKPFVADRTPFDVLGYTFADIKRDTLDNDLRARVYAQVAVAEQITREHLAGVLLLRPLPDQRDVPTSAQACPLYMHHVYLCVKDMIETLGPHLSRYGFVSAEVMSMDRAERLEDAEKFVTLVQEINGLGAPKLWTPGS